MFTITINASTPEEFKEKVKALYALFPDGNKKTMSGEPMQGTLPFPESNKPVESTIPPVAVVASASAEIPVITIEAVRVAVQEKTTAKDENKGVIRELLRTYNATSVTKLDPSHYAEFINKVKAIA